MDDFLIHGRGGQNEEADPAMLSKYLATTLILARLQDVFRGDNILATVKTKIDKASVQELSEDFYSKCYIREGLESVMSKLRALICPESRKV